MTLLTAILVAPILSYAATPQSWIGGSGIGYMRTAQVLKEGESSWFLNNGVEQLGSSVPATTATLSQSSMGYATSMGGHTEIGLLLPYANYTASPAASAVSGMRNTLSYLRHSISDSNKVEGFGTVLTLYSTILPGNAATNVTSGTPSFGAELNFSHWSKNSAIHLNVGTDTTDVWDQSGTPPFASDALLKTSLGIEWGVTEALGMTIQALTAQSASSSTTDMHMAVVFQYMPSEHWAFTLGSGVGMPSANVHGDTSIILGMTYSGNSQLRSRYSRTIDFSEQYNATKELTQTVDSMNSRIEQIDNRLQKTELQSQENAARVDELQKNVPINKVDSLNERAEESSLGKDGVQKNLSINRVELLEERLHRSETRVNEYGKDLQSIQYDYSNEYAAD